MKPSLVARRSSFAEPCRGRMQMIFVLPDYYEKYPKPCYGGWGKVYVVMAPDGKTIGALVVIIEFITEALPPHQ